MQDSQNLQAVTNTSTIEPTSTNPVTTPQTDSIEFIQFNKFCNIEMDRGKRRMIFHWTGNPKKKDVVAAMEYCIVLADQVPSPYDVVIDWKGESQLTKLVGWSERDVIDRQHNHKNIDRYLLCGGFPTYIRLIANASAGVLMKGENIKWFETLDEGLKFLNTREAGSKRLDKYK